MILNAFLMILCAIVYIFDKLILLGLSTDESWFHAQSHHV